ncbi:MAG: MotA/TolQ/ExbB proton channel family protein [Akkermansia sp.]|nr:MotA/TolQ/ExbB proton channel family protein [Akkermansia sp.]MDO4750544.1 MotA/TolQ/ExbB proton channel family protein [Akkermansia sp.]
MIVTLADESASFGLIDIFQKGGPLMWGLLVLSIVAFMAIFICSWTTRASAVLPKDMVLKVETFIRRKDYAGLIALCERDGSSFARTVNVIILFIQRNLRANMDAIREVAAAEGTRQTNILTRQISWLSDIGSIAPMVGLLGTVLGMMDTFWQMAQGNFEGVKQMQMASGISEAMITTAGGLILAIPCMLAYVVFRNYIQKHISDMEVAVTHVLSVISVQNDRDHRLGSISQVGTRSEIMDNDES